MCGRYASFREAQDLADAFDVDYVTDAAAAVQARYNLAPTDTSRIVLERTGKSPGQAPQHGPEQDVVTRELHAARWGLVPAWAKDVSVGARMINARAESVADKPAFAPALASRRCLVLADGYFEWRTDTSASGRTKTPFYIYRTDEAPIAFAGLYAWWPDPSRDPDDPGRWVLSTTIITQSARDGLEAIHDREPAVLPDDAVAAWLHRDSGAEHALDILQSPAPALSWHEVDRAVGSVRNQGAHLVKPA